jgi:hypothetical protein
VLLFPAPVPPLLPLPLPVVVPPPSPAPPVVVELVPVLDGVVAEVEVVELELVLVGVLVLDDVLEDVLVDVLVDVDDGVLGAEVDGVCCRHSLAASSAIVLAPWARLLRRVGLTVTGRACTSLFRAALAFTAVPQLPDCTAAEI